MKFPILIKSSWAIKQAMRFAISSVAGNALGAACVALGAEIAWVGGMSFLMFFPLKKLGMLRVSAEIEAAGMDVSKHGGSAYEGGAA